MNINDTIKDTTKDTIKNTNEQRTNDLLQQIKELQSVDCKIHKKNIIINSLIDEYAKLTYSPKEYLDFVLGDCKKNEETKKIEDIYDKAVQLHEQRMQDVVRKICSLKLNHASQNEVTSAVSEYCDLKRILDDYNNLKKTNDDQTKETIIDNELGNIIVNI